MYVNEFPEKTGSEGKLSREEHRLLSAAGQHPTRRQILRFIGPWESKSESEIATVLELSEWDARYHLSLLYRASLVEERDGRYCVSRLGSGLLGNDCNK